MIQKIDNSSNELIYKRRRKLAIKRTILLLIFMISILTTLCLKLPYFNITSIEVNNNRNLSKEEIKKLSNISLGNNLFYLDTDKSKNLILSNPYIESVNIKRTLPSYIIISVKERDAVYYIFKKDIFYIIDKNGIILQERKDINNMKLIKLEGFDSLDGKVGGSILADDKRKADTLALIAELLINNNTPFPITSLNMSNMTDIKLYSNNICIKIGNSDDLMGKINKAMNILGRKEFKDAKGYIDVSFSGNPVFFIEK